MPVWILWSWEPPTCAPAGSPAARPNPWQNNFSRACGPFITTMFEEISTKHLQWTSLELSVELLARWGGSKFWYIALEEQFETQEDNRRTDKRIQVISLSFVHPCCKYLSLLYTVGLGSLLPTGNSPWMNSIFWTQACVSCFSVLASFFKPCSDPCRRAEHASGGLVLLFSPGDITICCSAMSQWRERFWLSVNIACTYSSSPTAWFRLPFLMLALLSLKHSLCTFHETLAAFLLTIKALVNCVYKRFLNREKCFSECVGLHHLALKWCCFPWPLAVFSLWLW